MKHASLYMFIAILVLTGCEHTEPVKLDQGAAVTPTIPPSTAVEPPPTLFSAASTPSVTPTLGRVTGTATVTPSPTSDPLSSPHRLSGMLKGLDSGAQVNLRLELLQPGDTLSFVSEIWAGLGYREPAAGTVVSRFAVANGAWQAGLQPADLSLKPGLYNLIPEAEGYVSMPKSWVLILPERGASWHYTGLDFEFVHPNGLVRFGIPLCKERPRYGGEYIFPTGVPTVTPSFIPSAGGTTVPTPFWPEGSCFAGQFYSQSQPPPGLLGWVRGLAAGETARIMVYALPPSPGEYYAAGPAFPLGSGIHLATGRGMLAVPPTVSPDAVLTATLTVGNGPWGLIDPDLRGHKYLVTAESSSKKLSPPAYEVVLLAGKDPGLDSGLDFYAAPASPRAFASSSIQQLTLDEAKEIAGFHLLQPQYLPSGYTLRWVTHWIYYFDLEYATPANQAGQRASLVVREHYRPEGVFVLLQTTPPTPTPEHPLETVTVRGTQAVVRRNYAPPPWFQPPPDHIYPLYLEWSEKDMEFAVGGSLSLEELVKIAESLK